jgi:arylsulfatase A
MPLYRLVAGMLVAPLSLVSALGAADAPPNIVIIFADDLGYGDLGVQGHPTIRTPHIDRLASEGKRFTDFYAAPVCSPSRAALLTGRYPVRSGLYGRRGVLFPESKGGLPADEVTIAEVLRERGYATAHIGKWHLGVHAGSTPNDQGFDLSLGIPYSNDMDSNEGVTRADAMSADPPVDGWNVPLIRNGKIIERPADQRTLTQRYTAEALNFISRNKEKPFFLYFAHTFPHVPVFASPEFHGKSLRGRYGDTVEELDWSVGEVIKRLQEDGHAGNTLVVFTSDNGPWLTQGLQGGSAGMLREGKATTWEGGMRVPAIAWWPGRIAHGVVHDPANTMDLLPTVAALAAAHLPDDREFDGIDLAPVLFREEALPERPFFYYRGSELAACRIGKYKAHFSTQTGYSGVPPETHPPPLLFNLELDPGETTEIGAAHPEVIAQIEAAVDAHKAALKMAPPQFD